MALAVEIIGYLACQLRISLLQRFRLHSELTWYVELQIVFFFIILVNYSYTHAQKSPSAILMGIKKIPLEFIGHVTLQNLQTRV